MSTPKIYGITALFETPDQIIKAAKATAKLGFKNWDVHTPYPVHGMDDAMDLKPSKIGWVTLGGVLFACSFAVFFMWWTFGVSYPMVIGGKPLFSLPAFVPVMFAFTVLVSVIATVASLWLFFCKLPHNSHPLHDTHFLKRTGSDLYGVCIEFNNPGYDSATLRSHFEQLGGTYIEEILMPTETKSGNDFVLPVLGIRIPWSEWMFIGFLVATVGGVAFKFYTIYNQVLYDRIPLIHEPEPITGLNLREMGITQKAPFTWMDEQDKEKPQAQSKFFADGFSMREPVAGSIARGFMPYPYAGRPQAAADSLINPIIPDTLNLQRGRIVYNTYCSPCHDNFGNGNSRLAGQFPAPPSLHTDKLKNWPDGSIYHVITEGQNIMPSYASQISRNDRWNVVNYIRVLQRAQDAKDTDLK